MFALPATASLSGATGSMDEQPIITARLDWSPANRGLIGVGRVYLNATPMWEHQALPVFRKPPIPPSESELEAAAIDLERIQRGGIPLGAEQRLKAIAGTSSPVDRKS